MGGFFIQRRVLAIVISLLIVIVGALALRTLPVAMFPTIAPPTIAVNAVYAGANAVTVEQSVAAPIEKALTGIDGLIYTSSQSANDGSYSLTATFVSGTDVDRAATDVQNRVNGILAALPADVGRGGVTVSKVATSTLMALAIYSPQSSYDDLFISNYVTINVLDRLSRAEGVGATRIAGQRDYAMRVWLRPDRLADLKLQPSDVIRAISDQNAPAPAGQIGQPPQRAGTDFQYSVNVRGQLTSKEQFDDIVLRTLPDGTVLRLRAVARTELAAQSYASFGRYDGVPAAIITIQQKPGANALTTAANVRAVMAEAAKSFPPGLTWTTALDSTEFVSESIRDVVKTLLEAIVLVIIVVFVFLGTFRAMIIPILAVPVSLIGTFAVFIPLGFGVNTLTLFGIVLAIGIVVDDAIVVVEAVEHLIDAGRTPLEATQEAMREVSGPVVAIALVLCAVFVPVAFLGGLTGTLYRQFALTLSVSVLISALVALTTTPALCVMILRPRTPGGGPIAAFIRAFNRGFDALLAAYTRGVRFTLGHLPLVAVALLLITGGAYYLLRTVPGALVPSEDQGYVYIALQLPEGASLSRTDQLARRIEKYVQTVPGVHSIASFGGTDLLSGTATSNAALFFVKLDEWSDRDKKHGESIDDIIGAINTELGNYPEAVAFALNPPPIPGLGVSAGFQMQIEDRGGHSLGELAAAADAVAEAAGKAPNLTGINNSFSVTTPQIDLAIDRDKAKALGIDLTDVYSGLQAYLGGITVNDFVLFGRPWKVSVQAEPEYRVSPADIGRILVRSTGGDMVPLGTFSRAVPGTGAAVIGRYNGLRTAAINGGPAPGTSSGQALATMESIADSTLPAGFTYEWTGSALEEKQSGGQTALVFGFALVLVFFFLASLYESWSIPLGVLLGIPLGVFGAYAGISLRHIPSDVYVQIGLVMLIGLAAKNAILIVEFAKLTRDRDGVSYTDAALEAARLRLRPILMTSIAFIAGVVPLVTSTGAGAASRQSLGTAVFSGMIAATVLGVFFIPALYVIVCSLADRLAGARTARREPVSAREPATKPEPT